MSLDRSIPQETARAIDGVRQELSSRIRLEGPVVEVFFAAAGDAAAIAHGLGRVPDGYVVLMTIGGHVAATRVTEWTADLVWLVADADNTRARVYFVAVDEVRNA